MHSHAGKLLLALFCGLTLRCIEANKWVKPASWKTCWNSKAFFVVRDVPLQRCVEECQLHDRYKAVNYWRVRRNCELIDNDVNALLPPADGKPCLAIAKTDMTQTNECESCSRICDADSDRNTCLVKECFAPPVVNHGRFIGNKINVGAWKKLVCDEWYRPEANVDRVKCQDDACPDPPDITDATVATGNTHEGSVRTYTCTADHHIKKRNQNLYHWYYEGTWDSTADVTCHNGAWNVDFDCIPRCAITCSCPLVINVQDSQLTASSYYQADSYSRPPRKAKLNSDNHWAGGSDNTNQYIQVNFLAVKKVTQAILQRSTDARYYVTSYKVLMSTDCTSFQAVQSTGWPSGDKIFAGVDDTGNWFIHILDPPFQAQCVRINPRTYHQWPSLRFGLLGCDP